LPKSGIFTRRSLKTRVTLFTLAIFVFSIFLLAFYARYMLREDMQDLLGKQQFSALDLAVAEINEELDSRFNALNRVSTMVSAQPMDNPAALMHILHAHPVFQDLFNGGTVIIGKDGTALASLPLSANRVGVNYNDLDFVVAALKEGKASVGRPTMGRKLQAPVFAMVVPIRSAQGRVIGALAGVTDLSHPNFLDKIFRSKVTDGRFGHADGFYLIAPGHGLIVTATDKRHALQPLAATGAHPLLVGYQQGYEGYGVFNNTNGIEQLSAAKSIPRADWILASAMPTDDAFAPIYAMQRRLLLGALLLTLVAGALTWWMLRRQLAPMFSAMQSLADIPETGLHTPRLPITRQDEIGDLFGAFNRLLETLATRETALRESEARFRTLIDNNNAIILQTDPASGQILDANAAACLFYGWSPVQIRTKTLQEIHALNPDHITEKRLATAGHERNPFAVQHRIASGETKTVEVHSTPVTVGSQTQLVSIIHDITQRARTEQRFYRLMCEQTAILNSRIVGFVKLNDRKLVWGNVAFAEMMGYTLDELTGQSTKIVYPSDQAYRTFAETAYPVLQRGDVFRTECQYRRKNGSLGWYDVVGSMLESQCGESIWAFVDISARKQAQAELVTAKARAEQANRAKSRFLAAASHDLRQPLSALSMYVGVLQARAAPESRSLVAKIQACSDSLTEMLTDLLDVSKLDAGVVTPRLSNFGVEDFLSALVSVHSAEAQNKGLCLHLRPCSSVVTRTDQALLTRIVGNLIANAVRYTEKGGILVACRRHGGGQWIEVWDTGVGIPADKTETIFEEFTQLGDGAQLRGSGLGLAIVAKTAELLGLHIRLRTQPGRGSMFAVELPAGQAHVQAEPPAPRTENRSLRIGLVEDHAEVQQALVMALENTGHEVLAATTSQALLLRLGEWAPDIVISDHRLGGNETGVQVIDAARHAYGAQLPAIILTGDTDPALIRSMAARGIAVHSKPLQMDRLQMAISQVTEPRFA